MNLGHRHPDGGGAGGDPAAASAADPAIAYHDRIAGDWDARYVSGGFARRASFFEATILPRIASGGRWLDAGCGSGTFSRLLAGHGCSVTGVDGSAAMIAAAARLARERGHGAATRFAVVETVERLPFADASFAGGLCLSVVEYLKRPDDCLAELARVIAPGGTLVLSIPCRHAPVRLAQQCLVALRARAPRNLHYVGLSTNATTPSELGGWLSAHGFALIAAKGFDPVLPRPLWRVVRPSLLFALATRQAS